LFEDKRQNPWNKIFEKIVKGGELFIDGYSCKTLVTANDKKKKKMKRRRVLTNSMNLGHS
jgi:hypothetical protein